MPRSTFARPIRAWFACATLLVATSCQSTYYKTMEFFGREKRDILASRVEAAREDQAEAKEQFESALERFSKLVGDDGGDLKRAYDKAKSDFDASESEANDVRQRVKDVETVGDDLFDEWSKEIAQYTDDDLRRKSRATLRDTERRYGEMLAAMKRAEASMDPVLNAFRDNVLFLKHNLNAQAIASMKGAVGDLERNVQALITEMERSIAEADRFIQGLES